jgi:ABC-type transporter Mla subunit MlaD
VCALSTIDHHDQPARNRTRWLVFGAVVAAAVVALVLVLVYMGGSGGAGGGY